MVFLNLGYYVSIIAILLLKDKILSHFNKSQYRNKYFITASLFILWVTFFDDNNLIERFGYIHEINQLNDDKSYFTNKISEDSQKLKELKTNKKNLEKFAREQYLMHRDNEDVFIIVEE